jgi:hypothetical protein
VAKRACKFTKPGHQPCRAPPLKDGDHCRFHSPDHAQDVADARRLGGLRRRKERTVQAIYDFEGLRTVEDLQRVVEIALLDTLGMENSIARSRTLAYLIQAAAKLLSMAELDERVRALEETVTPPSAAGRRKH